MKRQRADRLVGLLLGGVGAIGLLFTWDAYQRRQSVDGMGGGMMGDSGMMGSMMVQTPDPLWYLLGTAIAVAVLGGGYLVVRDEFEFDEEPSADRPPDITGSDRGQEPTASEETADEEVEAQPIEADSEAENAAELRAMLDVLPEDERRILEPVLDSPGLTQIALRDRSEFSKSKVSQTVSELEKRGLLYREKQGRTYRVYPAEDEA